MCGPNTTLAESCIVCGFIIPLANARVGNQVQCFSCSTKFKVIQVFDEDTNEIFKELEFLNK